jgi:hypothetical protein
MNKRKVIGIALAVVTIVMGLALVVFIGLQDTFQQANRPMPAPGCFPSISINSSAQESTKFYGETIAIGENGALNLTGISSRPAQVIGVSCIINSRENLTNGEITPLNSPIVITSSQQTFLLGDGTQNFITCTDENGAAINGTGFWNVDVYLRYVEQFTNQTKIAIMNCQRIPYS